MSKVSQFATAQNLGTALCKALGLDAGTVVSLTVSALEDIPTVTVVFVVSEEQGNEVANVLKRYTLVELEAKNG